MKKSICILLVFIVSTSMISQVLNDSITDPGDISFTAYHNSDDGFSFVFLDHCPTGTMIRFIDEEWDGLNFKTENNEGDVLWTNDTGSTIDQGTVIHIQNADDGDIISASLGTAIEDNNGFNLANTGDGIMAITGTRSDPGVFLSFFGNIAGSTLEGTALVNGITANQHSSYGTGYYSGETNCTGLTIAACAERLNTHANWTIVSDFSYPSATMTSLDISGLLWLKKTTKLKLRYFPNPISKSLNISAEKAILNVSIYNIIGQQVFSKPFNEHSITIDLNTLSSGGYYVKCTSEQSSYVFKISKQ